MLELDPLEDLAPLRGTELLRELAELLPRQGVPFPPVPPELVAAMRVVGRWQFGTRPLDRPLLDVEGWVAEAVTEAPADYLVFGHDGRGVTGQAVHYHLVTGPLAVFLAERLDALADRPGLPTLATVLAALPDLLARLEEARALGRIAAGERWLLVDGDVVPSRWTRLAAPGETPQWHNVGQPPLDHALAALAGVAAGIEHLSR